MTTERPLYAAYRLAMHGAYKGALDIVTGNDYLVAALVYSLAQESEARVRGFMAYLECVS